MTTPREGKPEEADVKVPKEIVAEAAVWIAKLHGPSRSPKMEKDFRAWQAQSPAHRLAFERCTDVWEAVPGVRLADAYASASKRGNADEASEGSGGSRRLFALAAVLVLAGGGVGYVASNSADAHVTKVGEQQVVVLDDGTRMSLNTDTRVLVRMRSDERSVVVERGEALFEVAKEPRRPFVVRAAGSDVVAVGTAFAVRLIDAAAQPEAPGPSLAVTLIEGQVTLRPTSGLFADGVAPAKPVTIQPGERVLLTSVQSDAKEATNERVDRPNIDQLVAWKRSEAVFDNVSLPEAVAEMNRYSRTRIVLPQPLAMTSLRVSGLYRTGDSAGFAHAVASLHGLQLREQEGRLELALPQ